MNGNFPDARGVPPSTMHRPLSSFLAASFVVGVVSLALGGCGRRPEGPPTSASASPSTSPEAKPRPATTPAASSSGAPLAALVAVHPTSRDVCPLTVVPGKSLGPIGLGETLEDLKKAGFALSEVSEHHAKIKLPGKSGLHLGVSLCKGKIIDIWIDGLPDDLDCVKYEGKAVPAKSTAEQLSATFGPCVAEAPRIGGSFERCQDGGVLLGRSLGPAVQIRVRPKGWAFDYACEYATDDGSPVSLPPAEQTVLFEKLLLSDTLTPYWHVDKPGRDPLRIVKTSAVPASPYKMFGSDVVWIDASAATKGTAYLELPELRATKTRATLSFAYPIEGVRGDAIFSKASGEWRLVSVKLAER